MRNRINSVILVIALALPMWGQYTKNVWQDCDKNGEVMMPTGGMSNDHAYVDLGLSVKWATVNVGATTPEGKGNYYMWGHTSSSSNYSWDYYTFCYKQSSTKIYMTKYIMYESETDFAVDSLAVLQLIHDAANKNWGGYWRMPTAEEFQELIMYCDWKYTTVNGVKGYWITSKKEGYTQASIFLPIAGEMSGTSCILPDMFGFYWTSSLGPTSNSAAYRVRLESGAYYLGTESRCYGMTIRPVLDN